MRSPAAMERVLENLDQRLRTVEQVLPTLATKTDLDRFAAKEDLGRFATKDDLERFATKDDLERFATKDDLERFATKEDLERFATKEDLERFATKEDLERFATNDDLQRFATKDDLQRFATIEGLEEVKRHGEILVEEVRDDIRKVAEGVANLAVAMARNQTTLDIVVRRLDAHETILMDLVKRRPS